VLTFRAMRASVQHMRASDSDTVSLDSLAIERV
jgi:hypothetical protein